MKTYLFKISSPLSKTAYYLTLTNCADDRTALMVRTTYIACNLPEVAGGWTSHRIDTDETVISVIDARNLN